MDILISIFRTVANIFCAPSPDAQPAPPPQAPHKPAPQQQRPHTGRPHPQEASPRPARRHDQNQLNQQDAHYLALRQRARDEGAQMVQAFEASHAAYARKEGARAKELSNEGKAHQREMERLNAQASEWIFVENNKDSQPGEIDLHGLYVKEAITYADRAIQQARNRGDLRMNLIVGKGLHSPNGMAKLKPAVEGLMQKHGLVAELDPGNAGVLIVSLDGRGSGAGLTLRPDDISRRLESKDDNCVIM